MSMISAQIDELRERAKVLRQGRWSDGADDAGLMENAADTIWQLRDDLQRANAENAKLREEMEAAKHDLQVFSMSSVQLDADNAKLRELLDYMTPIAWYAASERERDRMRELGVGVEA